MRPMWPILMMTLVACGDKDDTETETEDTAPTLSPDADGDGYGSDVDCNDDNPLINPGATEGCNGIDDNCDGAVDEGVINTYYPDNDEDGYGNMDSPLEMCNIQPGLIEDGSDCDDGDPTINPLGTEICDDEDNNCDGTVDEGLIVTLYRDEDGDGYGQDGTGVDGCAGTGAEAAGDCDDFDASLYPGAREICGDGIINDCDASESDAIAACTGELSGGVVAGLARAFTGQEAKSGAGVTVGSAGDLNGDGTPEVLVSVPFAGGTYGEVYIIEGGTEGGTLANTASASIAGLTALGYLGFAASGAGDINGDGYDDLIATAPGLDDGYLFYGPVSGSLSDSDADAYFIDDSVLTGVLGGYSASAAGDMNGDGYDDLLFGAPYASLTDVNHGAAGIGYGPFEDGEFKSASAVLGETYYAHIGWSVAGLGDVNGDGDDDFITGGIYAGLGTDDGLEYPGGAFLFYGSVAPLATLGTSDADVAFAASTQFDIGGEVVAAAGDLNGDGYEDFLISEQNQDLAGRLAVFYGGADIGTARAFDDSEAEIIGEAAEDLAINAAAMGDANSDGTDDLVIGAPGHDGGTGAAYLVFGPITGTVDLATSGLKVLGDVDSGQLGASVAPAGDFDDDGLIDIIVGAPGADGKGAAYVVPRVGTGEY